MTDGPAMTAEYHEEEAHRLLQEPAADFAWPTMALIAAAQAHATLALALRLGPTTEERRQAAARLQAEEEARAVVLLISRADTPEAQGEVEGEWPEAIADALDRAWLTWLVHPNKPKELVLTHAGQVVVDEMTS